MPGTRGTRRATAGRVVLLMVGAVTVAGCSASVSIGSASTPTASSAAASPSTATTSEATVKKADVEKQVSEQLTRKVGQAPKSVTCPGDLAAQTGTTMRCTLTADDGTTIGLTTTVTSVDASTGNVNFDIKVDSAPITTPTS